MAESVPASGPPPSTTDTTTTTTPLAHIQQIWDAKRTQSPIYRMFLADATLVSASHGRVVARMDLLPVHLNSSQSLHGSVSATIVDWAGGLAIASSTGRERTGVSTDIHVSYVSAARLGDSLEIEAWVSRVGRNMGYTSVEIRKQAPPGAADGTKGPVVCMGSHTKFLNC